MKLDSALARKGVIALFIAVSLASPAAPRAAGTGAQDAAASTASIRIGNFGQVDSTYYRGARPVGRDFADLAALGVKLVIDLTGEDSDAGERAMVAGAGMRYVQIPMTTHEPPTANQLSQFLQLVRDPANQPVYVHCVGGRHRTGLMTAAYRMTNAGWTAERAFSEMKRYKFGADYLHPEFKAFVLAYRVPAPSTAAAPEVAVSAKP